MAGNTFEEGYALVIGVGADLPNTVDDAEGLAMILQDPERCAYPREEHVQLLTAEQTTRDKVLAAFDLLAERTDESATVIIYFSGHGYQVEEVGKTNYYLMPYEYDVDRLAETAINGDEFAAKVSAIKSRKLLILLDCCHAGGLDVVTSPQEGVMKTPLGMRTTKAPLPAAAVGALAGGSGRVIITSSRAAELSYAGSPYSAFTTALIEALCGKGAAMDDGFVRVTDLAMYAAQMVPALTGDKQHPTQSMDKADNYKVAFYAGGAAEPKALPDAISKPRIEAQPGSGDFAPAPTFDQRWQTVGTQIINAGNIGFQNLELKADRVYQAQGDMTFNENK